MSQIGDNLPRFLFLTSLTPSFEPLWHGVPTIFGPHMHGQPELLEVVAEYQAAKQLPIEQLESALDRLLQGGPEVDTLRQNSLKLIKDARGSLQRTVEQLQTLY